MNEILQQTISDTLITLSSNLGVTLSHLYEVCAKQGYVQGWSEIIMAFIFVGLIIISLIFMKINQQPSCKEVSDQLSEKEIQTATSFINFFLAIIIIALIIAACVNISHGVKHILNPEFYIIEKLTEGGKK